LTATVAAASSGTDLTARQEWARYWPAMFACMCGMLLSGLPTYAFGLFIEPMQQAYGWNRSEISAALMFEAVLAVFAFPLVGRLVDRFGVRKVALLGTLLNGALLGLIGLINNGAIAVWWLSWALFTIGYAMVNPTVWAKAISRRFKAAQGMAIGVLMCGAVLATLTIPSLARWSIDAYGWRWAFLIVGMTPSLVAFLAVLAFIRYEELPTAATTAAEPVAAVQPGYAFAQAIRSPAVIKLLLSVLLTMSIVVGSLVHMVPMLGERGLDHAAAAAAISIYGIGSIATKLVCGWISDRGGSRWLGALTFGATAPACAILLLTHGNFVMAATALVFFGIAAGAVLQLSAFLTIRYAGLRAFGQVYGLAAGLMAISGGVGPLLAGAIFDLTGNYTALMLVGLPVAAVTMLMMATLGPYPQFEAEPSAA